MRPPDRYWRKTAKRALKQLRIRKRHPRVAKQDPPKSWGRRRCHLETTS